MDIRGSRAERIHLSHLAVIFIQCKDSSIGGRTLSMLKLAFFFFRYNYSSFTFEDCWVIFTDSSVE